MMFTAVSTVVMMLIMLNIPASTLAVCIGLFFCRFLFEYRLAGFYRLRYGRFGQQNLSNRLFHN
ncbi:D-glucarate permease [Klebsiella variicola]|uniref:D-glucarate permease n=1 Tax=Klebsiella variicola TaxID=244366 RepID=A0A7H4MG98_KLEVA|nr:D-glucarate permease [Klebsiella variicola]